MKKRAFTMVELIFVIVILGILAAVAVPKLNASREDARLTVALANARTLLSDVQTYYTAQGSIPQNLDFRTITSVPFYEPQVGNDYKIYLDGKPCYHISAALGENKVHMGTNNNYIDASPLCKRVLQEANFIRGIDKDALKEAAGSPITTLFEAPARVQGWKEIFVQLEGSGVEW